MPRTIAASVFFFAATFGSAAAQTPSESPSVVFSTYWQIVVDGKVQSRVTDTDDPQKMLEKYKKRYAKKAVELKGPFQAPRPFKVRELRDNPALVQKIKTELKLDDAAFQEKHPQVGLFFGDKVTAEFRKKVGEIATAIGVTADDLMVAMALETGGTFDPALTNPDGAVGLIQLTQIAIDDMNNVLKLDPKLTKAALKKMTGVEQLDIVQKYFEVAKKRGKAMATAEDLYCVIFCPAAAGKPADFVAYDKSVNEAQYNANKSLDTGGGKDGKPDGKVTRAEIDARVQKWRKIGLDTQVTFAK